MQDTTGPEALREWIEAYWYDAIPKDELLARIDAGEATR